MRALHFRASIVSAAALFLVLVTPAGVAQAATPVFHGFYSYGDSYTDAEECAAEGFTLEVTVRIEGHETVFENPDGTWYALVQESLYWELSGNGVTLNEHDEIHYYSSLEEVRMSGLLVHILGDTGLVVRDAGRVVLHADGSVDYVRGPHPQLEGDVAFCAMFL